MPQGTAVSLRDRGSFSETYKRNAFNNGFIVFECPELVEHLRAQHGADDAATVVAGDLEIDYERSVLRAGDASVPFPPLSTVAQELDRGRRGRGTGSPRLGDRPGGAT